MQVSPIDSCNTIRLWQPEDFQCRAVPKGRVKSTSYSESDKQASSNLKKAHEKTHAEVSVNIAKLNDFEIPTGILRSDLRTKLLFASLPKF